MYCFSLMSQTIISLVEYPITEVTFNTALWWEIVFKVFFKAYHNSVLNLCNWIFNKWYKSLWHKWKEIQVQPSSLKIFVVTVNNRQFYDIFLLLNPRNNGGPLFFDLVVHKTMAWCVNISNTPFISMLSAASPVHLQRSNWNSITRSSVFWPASNSKAEDKKEMEWWINSINNFTLHHLCPDCSRSVPVSAAGLTGAVIFSQSPRGDQASS